MNLVGLLVVASALLVSVLMATPAAQAQDPTVQEYTTCAAYGRMVGTGGELAVAAAEQLRSLNDSRAVARAFEVVIDAEADVPPSGSRPGPDSLALAFETLATKFDPLCLSIDKCPLVWQATGAAEGSSADAARLLFGLSAPSPPGIGAAMLFIAGDIETSPFHDSIAEAQQQVANWFSCPVDVSPPLLTQAELCGHAAVVAIPEGPLAIQSAQILQNFGVPANVDAALDVIIDAADFTGNEPSLAQIDAAVGLVMAFFDQDACGNVDRCGLVFAIVEGPPNYDRQGSAATLRRLETPAPPGIDAALALIAGQIDTSPFHASVAEAVQQIDDYYSFCGGLVITGSPMTTPLTAAGATLILAGASLVVIRRRSEL